MSRPKEDIGSFFKRLEKKFSREDLARINYAYTTAKRVHEKQKRDSGERYFEHLRRCVLILVDELKFYDADFIIILLFHDTFEDCPWYVRLFIRFYFGKKIALAIKDLSKPKLIFFLGSKKLRDQYYFWHLKKAGSITKLRKTIDRLDNMRTIWGCAPAKQRRKIEETEKYFFRYLEDIRKEYPREATHLEQELRLALAQAKKSLTGGEY
ncbi:MAG: HD domain-containing protein [Patescibacteria group bacterium]|nr:HD domain-containing protein [Patescibacteria group bacterium]